MRVQSLFVDTDGSIMMNKEAQDYYNYKRPHCAIHYLVPAVEMRQAYWQRENAREQGQTLT